MPQTEKVIIDSCRTQKTQGGASSWWLAVAFLMCLHVVEEQRAKGPPGSHGPRGGAGPLFQHPKGPACSQPVPGII